jgi:hypothetical protein
MLRKSRKPLRHVSAAIVLMVAIRIDMRYRKWVTKTRYPGIFDSIFALNPQLFTTPSRNETPDTVTDKKRPLQVLFPSWDMSHLRLDVSHD